MGPTSASVHPVPGTHRDGAYNSDPMTITAIVIPRSVAGFIASLFFRQTSESRNLALVMPSVPAFVFSGCD